MTAGDGDLTVPGRLCRPSPSSFKKTAPSPSGPRTDGGKPSVPVLSDPGRTGRLISLLLSGWLTWRQRGISFCHTLIRVNTI